MGALLSEQSHDLEQQVGLAASRCTSLVWQVLLSPCKDIAPARMMLLHCNDSWIPPLQAYTRASAPAWLSENPRSIMYRIFFHSSSWQWLRTLAKRKCLGRQRHRSWNSPRRPCYWLYACLRLSRQRIVSAFLTHIPIWSNPILTCQMFANTK